MVDLSNYSVADDTTLSIDEIERIRNCLSDGDLPFPDKQLFVEAARENDAGVIAGSYIEEELEPAEFGRIAAQAAKQVIVQKVREAERAKIVEAYKDRVGELVMGVVKRVERGNVFVDLGGSAEAVIFKEHMIHEKRSELEIGSEVTCTR